MKTRHALFLVTGTTATLLQQLSQRLCLRLLSRRLPQLLSALLAAMLSLSAATALAHHPVEAKFDMSKTLTLKGRVTDVDWANPHVHVFINVADNKGVSVNWAIELASTVELDGSGWSPTTVAIGDLLTVAGPAARNGSHQLWGDKVQAADGAVLFTVAADVFSARLATTPGPTPRWPDNQPRLGPPLGQTGYWAAPDANSLVEDGAKVSVDAHGLLANIADAGQVAPFQDWARDLYALRQRNHLKDDPLFLNCIPPAGPRQFQLPFGLQFVEERERGRIFVLLAGGNGNWRLLYTDGRTQIGQVTGNDDNPLFYGRSLANWEGDTLVVSTSGFNETFWFSNGGLPHTKLLQLTERFTRSDLNTLHYQVTINDEGAYTRPWTSSWDLHWVSGQELPEYYCQDNRQ
jgi:Family of unknown function (DUF6152)